jgi:hypothetical protein
LNLGRGTAGAAGAGHAAAATGAAGAAEAPDTPVAAEWVLGAAADCVAAAAVAGESAVASVPANDPTLTSCRVWGVANDPVFFGVAQRI